MVIARTAATAAIAEAAMGVKNECAANMTAGILARMKNPVLNRCDEIFGHFVKILKYFLTK
ncbi:hypothetical protein DZC30_17865 [Comamonas testosteroni]|uniref:Uncharacterized protein n=1 Tax=Comamonas testosteroni TaxID=285 RepID=A0A373FEL7_COMTE|nr:hypothetical protein DZC30_17865 [Comamonas testosteroni]